MISLADYLLPALGGNFFLNPGFAPDSRGALVKVEDLALSVNLR